MSENEFVELVTHGQPAAPAYFSVDAAMNKRVHPLLNQSRMIPALSPTQIRQALKDGVRVVDARNVDDFTAGHLRGSVNVGFDGRFAETGGMVADIGDQIALITYPGEEQEAALRLARVGSDNAIGYLTVDHDGVFPTELSDLVRTAPRISPTELDGLLAEDAVVLVDIRNQGEVEQGRIPGSVHIPLAQLRARLDLLPTDRIDRRALRGRLAFKCGRVPPEGAGLRQRGGSGRRLQRLGRRARGRVIHNTTRHLKGTVDDHDHPDPYQLRVDDRRQPDRARRLLGVVVRALSGIRTCRRTLGSTAPRHRARQGRHARPNRNSPRPLEFNRSRQSWRSATACWSTASPAPCRAAALEDLINQVKALDMDEVRAKIAARKAAATAGSGTHRSGPAFETSRLQSGLTTGSATAVSHQHRQLAVPADITPTNQQRTDPSR